MGHTKTLNSRLINKVMDQVLLGHRRYDIVDHILLRNCSAVPNMSKPHGKGRNIMGHDPKQSTKPIQNSKRPFPSMRRPSQGSWPSCQGCLRDWAPLPSAFPPLGRARMAWTAGRNPLPTPWIPIQPRIWWGVACGRSYAAETTTSRLATLAIGVASTLGPWIISPIPWITSWRRVGVRAPIWRQIGVSPILATGLPSRLGSFALCFPPLGRTRMAWTAGRNPLPTPWIPIQPGIWWGVACGRSYAAETTTSRLATLAIGVASTLGPWIISPIPWITSWRRVGVRAPIWRQIGVTSIVDISHRLQAASG